MLDPLDRGDHALKGQLAACVCVLRVRNLRALSKGLLLNGPLPADLGARGRQEEDEEVLLMTRRPVRATLRTAAASVVVLLQGLVLSLGGRSSVMSSSTARGAAAACCSSAAVVAGGARVRGAMGLQHRGRKGGSRLGFMSLGSASACEGRAQGGAGRRTAAAGWWQHQQHRWGSSRSRSR